MTHPPRRQIADLLSRLVATPSINATGRPSASPPYGEAAMAELLAAYCRELGAEVRLQEVMPGRPNMIALFRGEDSSRRLLLEAHSDVVPTDGMEIAPFEPVVSEGKLYGRGACDTKGPMAAMLTGIAEVLDQGPPPADIAFVSCCDEEQGARGAAALMDGGFHADAAIVAEPTSLEIVTAHKGALRWRIATTGRAAHSSTPHLGINAIEQMAEVIQMVATEVRRELSSLHNPLLGSPTVSIGTISGGTQVNIVPERCVIQVDRRLLPEEKRQEVTADLAARLRALGAQRPMFAFELEESEYYPPLSCPRDAPPVRLLETACTAVLGEARFAGAPYGTDGGRFAEAGIPTVIFGPGSIEQAHRSVEWVELRQVEQAAAIYAECIRRF